eukprot:IDg1151t1
MSTSVTMPKIAILFVIALSITAITNASPTKTITKRRDTENCSINIDFIPDRVKKCTADIDISCSSTTVCYSLTSDTDCNSMSFGGVLAIRTRQDEPMRVPRVVLGQTGGDCLYRRTGAA